MKVIAWPAYSSRAVNPYTSLLYEHVVQQEGVQVYEFKNKLALTRKFDILHVHWPEAMLIRVQNPFLAFLYIFKFLISILSLKIRGARIVWTAHNLRSHESNFPFLRRFYLHWFSSSVDGLIALSKTSVKPLFEQYPCLSKKPFKVTPHGHYRGVYQNSLSNIEARQQLSLKEDDLVLLFLGQIRPYKNVLELIKVFKEMPNSGLKLLISGLPHSEDLKTEIENSCKEDSRIYPFLDFVEDSKLQLFFNASDLVILPYEEILNSGTALLSLSFNKPIVVPDKGALAELKDFVGGNWVYTYSGNFSSFTLIDSLNWLKSSCRQNASLQDLDWFNIAKDTVNLYKEVLEKN